MSEKEKKQWVTPKLMVFTKATDAEKVLGYCKVSGTSAVYTLAVGCMQRWQCTPRCYDIGPS